MEHPGGSSGNSNSGSGSEEHPGGPVSSSLEAANPKTSSTTTIAPAATSPYSVLHSEGDGPRSSTSRTTTLYTLLKRDIEPQGRRDFIPFFRHYDLLRLSECSKDLMGYSHHLSACQGSSSLTLIHPS